MYVYKFYYTHKGTPYQRINIYGRRRHYTGLYAPKLNKVFHTKHLYKRSVHCRNYHRKNRNKINRGIGWRNRLSECGRIIYPLRKKKTAIRLRMCAMDSLKFILANIIVQKADNNKFDSDNRLLHGFISSTIHYLKTRQR